MEEILTIFRFWCITRMRKVCVERGMPYLLWPLVWRLAEFRVSFFLCNAWFCRPASLGMRRVHVYKFQRYVSVEPKMDETANASCGEW